jgi:hypothetical protein
MSLLTDKQAAELANLLQSNGIDIRGKERYIIADIAQLVADALKANQPAPAPKPAPAPPAPPASEPEKESK